jgi:hypothetical protein
VKKVTAAMALVASLAAAQLVASPAHASKGCVTPKEFGKAKTGMSIKAVAKLFGTNGSEMSRTEGFGSVIVIRDYKACTTFGAVTIMFTNGKLETKSGIF